MQAETKPKVIARLNRIEGQVRGLVKMIEDDRYCMDVLTQIQAVRAALQRVEADVMTDHVNHCVRHAMTGTDSADREAKADELIAFLGKAMRG
jgi:DNA-binding FrmR family transcriptional regulator